MPARRLGRCGLNCLAGDEARLAEALTEWRRQTATQLSLAESELASDRALFAIVSAPPGTHFELESVAGLHQGALPVYGPGLVEVVRRARNAGAGSPQT
jgi:ribonuclease D